MNKITVLLMTASLLLTSCDLKNLLSFDFEDSSEESDSCSSDYESESKSSTSKPSKYDEYKDREWYGIGLESLVSWNGENIYYNALIRLESFKVGKYMCNDDNYGHYNVYICANGDIAYDNLEDLYAFDKSEYHYVKAHFDEKYTMGRYYSETPVGYTREEAMLSYYFELACEFGGVYIEDTSFNSMDLKSIDDVYAFYGINILDESVTTTDIEDESAYVLKGLAGYGPSYSERYVSTTYMNCNPLFKFVGLPPFLSESNVTDWDYQRGVTNSEKRGFRVWQDKQLVFYLTGYTAEEAKTWPALFAAAGYKQTSLHESFDDPDALYDSLDYEGTIDIFGVTVSTSGGSTSYFKNTVSLGYAPSKWVNNEPVEYLVQYVIKFASTSTVEFAGTFLYHDDGLHVYYSEDGVAIDTILVNSSGELVTESITRGIGTNNPWVVSFFFPHKMAS